MNHCYRILWNEAAGAFVAVPETASRKGRRGSTGRARCLLALAGVLALACPAQAGPQGEQVRAGQGSVSRDGTTTTVYQSSARLAIDWQSFSIGANETVNFVQPGSSAIALNRVVGTEGSQILGRLNANGQVFLLNPNGVLFGRTAQVSVGGIVASTLGLSDADFMAGRTALSGSGGTVRNEGTVRAADGGYVALIGGQVHNEGTLVADRGTVALAAGSRVTLDFAGDGLLNLAVHEGTMNALVRNGGVVRADGGTALLTAKAADALAGTVVNNTGIVQARTLDNRGGVIRLLGGFEGGTVDVGGTLDVSAPGGGGAGFVDTSGAHVRVAPGTHVALGASGGWAGRWLLDPTDITIDAAAAAAFVVALDAGGSVTASTTGAGSDAGDLTVASPIVWSGTGVLTLEADRNIAIDAEINGANGGLALVAGNAISAPAPVHVADFGLQSGDWRQVAATLPAFGAANFHIDGGSFLRATGGDGSGASPYRIGDAYGLQGVGSNASMLGLNYVLANDIDASASAGWNYGSGFRPIGYYFGDEFTGRFDGAGHTVSGITASWYPWDNVGLFGTVGASGTVRDLGVRDSSFQGGSAGGVAGWNNGTLANVWSDATVGGYTAGGVVGYNLGTVTGSHADGAVSGSIVGGFVGQNSGTITRSWATGAVSGDSGAGGFVGINEGAGDISFAYATGNVTSVGRGTGGFVGLNTAAIRDAYARGNVSARLPVFDGIGALHAGGFFGNQEVGGSVTRVFSTGSVDNDSVYVGGLGGRNFGGTVTSSYWDTQTSGRTRGVGGITAGTGRTTAQMMQQSTFAPFDFGSDWFIYDARTYPMLRGFLTPLTITANDATKVYDGTGATGGNGVSFSAPPDARLLGSATYSAAGATNVGTYALAVDGFYSGQQGYLITHAPGTLTITPKALAVVADDKSKPAGAADPLLTFVASGFVAGETSATALVGDLSRAPGETAGDHAITQGTLAARNGNYAIAYTPGVLTITGDPAPAPSPAQAAGQGGAADAPYPQPEGRRAPGCQPAAREGAEAQAQASCAPALGLRIVDAGMRLPVAATGRP